MATKKVLVERVEYIKSLIEEKGHEFEYSLPKNYKKDDVYKILNDADEKYKNVKGQKFQGGMISKTAGKVTGESEGKRATKAQLKKWGVLK
jgi:hypothetical protein